MLGSSALAMCAVSGAAIAQGSAEIETVVVSGSRLVTNGVNAPTPVTVVTAESLSVSQPASIVNGLLDLPQFRASASVANPGSTTGSNGADNFNLRGLGTNRTLVLMDGRRVIPNNQNGATDAALIPESLVSRVDVVTGGASAQYGSDAVAGVANFLLNKSFEGIKADVQAGISTYGDKGSYKTSITAGTSLFGGRFHIEGNVLDQFDRGIPHAIDRQMVLNKKQVAFVQNPSALLGTTNASRVANSTATNPDYVLAHNVNTAAGAFGGLITTAGPLKGITFNANGTPVPFNFGDPTLATTTYTVNGTDTNGNIYTNAGALQHRDQLFGYASYDLSDDITLYAQVLAGKDRIFYRHFPNFQTGGTAFTIFSDNAYLPASIKTTMAASKIASFSLGRVSPDISIPGLRGEINVGQVTAGLDGKIPGSTWSYKVYGQMGRSLTTFKTTDDAISDHIYAATDAVLSNGNIVCRITLTNPNSGCVPVNLFGSTAGYDAINGTSATPSSNVTQAAKNYINGTAVQRFVYQQDVAEGSVQGDLFDLPAGTVSLATGVGYRREHLNSTADDRSTQLKTGVDRDSGVAIQGFPTSIKNTRGGFERSNPQPSTGHFDVKEVFVETQVPVFKNMFLANSLEINAAARYVEYSLSGGVEPWKIGAVYQPFPELRFRYTHSVDIRAPNIGELYKGSAQSSGTVQDPFTLTSGTVLANNIGNPNLVPEIAIANTVGVVYTPEWLDGFSASLDYYAINVHGAIVTLGSQTVVNDCYAGNASSCTQIQRGAATPPATLGTIGVVQTFGQNVGYVLTKGFDFEAEYGFDLADIIPSFDGRVSTRAIVNVLDELTTFTPGSSQVQTAGDNGANEPKWLTTLQANYTIDDWRFFVQERIIGSGKMTNTDPSAGGQVHDFSFAPGANHVPLIGYTNLNVSYQVTPELQAYFNVNNVWNRDPPPVAGFSRFGTSGGAAIYSVVGRYFLAGLKIDLE